MYSLNIPDLSYEEFLLNYWQQRPLLIRQGFENFNDAISADELAGLAAEEEIESRLVYRKAGQWHAEHGPFERYDHLGTKEWSLIVQSVDHWDPRAAELIRPFDFIPNWRLDDLMVSFAAPGGGVGPHIDNYDVFIIQGSGKRHWRVGDSGQYKEFAAHDALLHTEDFEAIIDAELEAGDILYIPPGFPHEGISTEQSMSFSVGFRTTRSADLFAGLADFLAEHDYGKDLIEDPARPHCENPGEINNTDYLLIKNKIDALITNESLMRQFVGEYTSRAKHALDLLEENDQPYSENEVLENLLQGKQLHKLGGLRCFYLQQEIEDGIIYIDGEQIVLAASLSEVLILLCDRQTLSREQLSSGFENELFASFITAQINQGRWYFYED